jgi:hypothetical protein
MPVHVSIHDVSPAWKDEVEAALERCHAHGIKPALLVVPNFHGQAPLLDFPSYCARLRELQAEGHEIYLHGFFHQSRTREKADVRWLFAQKVVSGGEAEFSDVTPEEAKQRLDEGEEVLAQAGLTPTGFIPPAWSMPRWMHEILKERGYRFTEDHLRVYDPARRRSAGSVVLNYATRSTPRLFSTVAYNRVAKHARALFPARVAIHPADMRFALLRAEIEHLLGWSRGDVVDRGSELLSLNRRS